MQSDKYGGVYRASVVVTQDPEARKRIRLLIPDVLGDSMSHWAEPSASGASVPAANSIVWVAFNAGDPNYPVYFV